MPLGSQVDNGHPVCAMLIHDVPSSGCAHDGCGLTTCTVPTLAISSPSLISGQVDAVIGAFRNFELNQMDILERPGRAFFVEEEGVPGYDELILVAHVERLSDDRLARFLTALEQGVQYLVNHPDESWQLFIKGRDDLDDELNRRAWTATLPRFALRPAALDSGRYARFAEFLKERGMLETALPTDNYAVELER